MKIPERTATWRREQVVLRVSRLTWRLEQAERECARAWLGPRGGSLDPHAGGRSRLSPARVHQITAGRTCGRAGCRGGGAAGHGLAGARRLSALSGSAQRRYWRHADHSLWPVVQVSESHRENVQNGGAARGVRKQRRLRKVIRTIPGAVLDRRFRAGLAAEGFFEDAHRSLPSHACVHPDAGRARPNPAYRSGGHRHGSERRADRLRLHDLHPGDPRACVAGPHRPCADEALLAAPQGWPENVRFGLDEGLGLRDGPRRRRIGRVRPRPGDPGVRSAPPARLHLAHDHPRVGRGGRHG